MTKRMKRDFVEIEENDHGSRYLKWSVISHDGSLCLDRFEDRNDAARLCKAVHDSLEDWLKAKGYTQCHY